MMECMTGYIRLRKFCEITGWTPEAGAENERTRKSPRGGPCGG